MSEWMTSSSVVELDFKIARLSANVIWVEWKTSHAKCRVKVLDYDCCNFSSHLLICCWIRRELKKIAKTQFRFSSFYAHSGIRVPVHKFKMHRCAWHLFNSSKQKCILNCILCDVEVLPAYSLSHSHLNKMYRHFFYWSMFHSDELFSFNMCLCSFMHCIWMRPSSAWVWVGKNTCILLFKNDPMNTK